MKVIHCVVMLQTLVVATATARAAEGNPFDAEVLDVRPRVFLRNEPFEGLTIEKLRSRIDEPEFAGVSEKWRARPMGRALRWMLEGRRKTSMRPSRDSGEWMPLAGPGATAGWRWSDWRRCSIGCMKTWTSPHAERQSRRSSRPPTPPCATSGAGTPRSSTAARPALWLACALPAWR